MLRPGHDRHQRPRPVLLHLHGRVEHFQRARGVERVHQVAEDLRVHVVDLALEDDDGVERARVRGPGSGIRVVGMALTHQHANDVRRLCQLAVAGAVTDLVHAHRWHGAKRRRVLGQNQRPGRRQQLGLNSRGIDRSILQQRDRRRCRHRKHAVRRSHHAAADVERRHDNAVGVEPLEREHGADNVDDGIDGANFVEVHLVDRHAMDAGFGSREAMKHRDRPGLAGV